MKHLLLLLTITIFCTQLHAQKWGNRTAVWKYHFDWAGYHYYNFNVKVESDTVILGQPCIRIGNYRPEFSFLSGDTVYFLKDGSFRPTYYFGAKPGDTISFYNYAANECEGSATKLAIVEAVDSINAGTKFIKQFTVNVLLDSARPDLYITRFKYYENIGSDNDLYPMFGCVIDDDYYTLCNYGDSSIAGYYLFPQDQSSQCALVKETAINETQKLTINHSWQSANILNINLQEYASISIYNAIGQCIHQSQATPGNNDIVFNQPPGIYIVLAQSANGIGTSKLYKP